MRHIPLVIFAIFAAFIASTQHLTDVSLFFTPAARLILQGGDAYALHTEALPFVYPPFVLPLLTVYALPGAYVLGLLVNAGAAVWIVRNLRVSGWWVLYPPVIIALWFGTFDLLVVALALFAYRRRNAALMALALLIKPQAALFWCVPLAFEHPRAIGRMVAVGGAVTVASMLIMPSTWASWLTALAAHPGSLAVHYAMSGYSLFAVGALSAPILWARLRQPQWRALVALFVPFVRYYSAVGLIGYGGAWIVALAWGLVALVVLTGVRALWLEPVMVLGMGIWIAKHSTSS